VPVDLSMFTGYGVKHTDVTNPIFEFLIFGDKGLPVIQQKICRTTSVSNESIKCQNYRICVHCRRNLKMYCACLYASEKENIVFWSCFRSTYFYLVWTCKIQSRLNKRSQGFFKTVRRKIGYTLFERFSSFSDAGSAFASQGLQIWFESRDMISFFQFGLNCISSDSMLVFSMGRLH